MRKLTKFLVCLLATIIAVPTFVGCVGDTGISIDKTKTQLYIGNYDGGYGHVWLDHLIEGFEQKYAETSFEEGKKGVQIVVQNNKNLSGDKLYTSMASSINEIYFTENFNYYTFVNENKVLDLTDLVTTTNYQDGLDGKTIESKMNDVQKAYYGAEVNSNTKYYAVPHYAGFSGLMYDIDLFEEENLYFSGENAGEFVSDSSETRTNGPDGQYGTKDDGLPATYEEFFELLDYMVKDCGITPFIFTGKYPTYINWLISALFVDYEGLDNLKALLNLDGSTVSDIIELEGNNLSEPKSVALNNSNGYKLFGTKGKLEALKFIEKILSNEKYYYKGCISSTFSNLTAQKHFLQDGVSQGGKRIAFLAEGIWWEEEANGSFVSRAKSAGDEYSRENSNLGILPLPKGDATKVGEKNTLVDINKSVICVSAKIKDYKKELAKKFIAYACSDEALIDFTLTTDCPKALSYEMGSDYDDLTNYGKNIWDVYNESDYVLHYSANDLYKNHLNDLEMFKAGFNMGTNGVHPFSVMCKAKAGNKTMSAEAVMKDILKFHDATWWNTTINK